MEPGAPCDLYTKIGPPKPVPPPAPPAPVAPVEDQFYPIEEREEMLTADVPAVTGIANDGETCSLRGTCGTATVRPYDLVCGSWFIQSIISEGLDGRPAVVAMERRWARWGLLVFATVNGTTVWDQRLRRPLGADLSTIRSPRYDSLTANDPDYFKKAVDRPDDYLGVYCRELDCALLVCRSSLLSRPPSLFSDGLFECLCHALAHLGQRIMADSPHGEASYLTAAKFLPPIADYIVIGDVQSPVKGVVTMDGKIKRSEGGDAEPPSRSMAYKGAEHRTAASACHFSAETKHVSVHDCAADDCKNHATLAEAQAACAADSTCGGINAGPYGSGPVSSFNTRRGVAYISTWPCPGTTSYLNSSGWLVTNAGAGACRSYTGGDHPPPPPPPACHTSADCRKPPMMSHYCELPAGGGSGRCVPGGGTIFDGPSVLKMNSSVFSEMQAGVIGGYLRVASVGAYDVASGRGLEMMALGPLTADNDTVLVAIRPHSPELSFKFEYYSVSLDRRHPQDSVRVAASTFYLAVLEHSVEWAGVFAAGMQVTLPYAERRQRDMARGVIVAVATVFIGHEPNYGTDVFVVLGLLP